jgi:hypothetical protein
LEIMGANLFHLLNREQVGQGALMCLIRIAFLDASKEPSNTCGPVIGQLACAAAVCL